jgi:hypothetical protein
MRGEKVGRFIHRPKADALRNGAETSRALDNPGAIGETESGALPTVLQRSHCPPMLGDLSA